jgi:hypothetical protein
MSPEPLPPFAQSHHDFVDPIFMEKLPTNSPCDKAAGAISLVTNSVRGQSAMRVDGIVMPALVAGIYVLNPRQDKDVDGRNKSGHDGVWFYLNASSFSRPRPS